ncbi:hypothetical protein [Micromonospora coxensis]|uniref:hypothetical protein n=1 Tax=Micromonospora coxensis TaxID=356852 RepID=UPI003429F4E6
MTARPFVWVGCGDRARARIEVYAPAGLAALAAVVYACEAHAPHAAEAVTAAGYAPNRTRAALPTARRCGYVFRFPTAGGAR